jgi:hypothetical protein
MTHPLVTPDQTAKDAQIAEAFDAGRRAGLATAALALSVVAYVSLLGAEKALLAIALGVIARRGSRPGSAGRKLATIAMGIAAVFLVSIVFVLIMFWDHLVELVNHLKQLS